MLDDDLRAQLADWVRPVVSRPIPDVREVRRRARRHGLRRAATAAAVTAVAVATVVAVVASVPGTRRPAPAPRVRGSAGWLAAPGTWYPGAWRPAGALPAAGASPAAAPYFVTIGAGQAAAVVTDAFTGRVVSSVPPPRPGQSFAGVAAAGDDRTFVLAARETGSVGFYEMQLRPDGREEPLSPLFTLPVRTVPAFAVSPDASLLAYTTGTGIEVVSLAAGTGRSWTAAGGQVHGLSWGGDTTLAFEWDVSQPGGPPPAGAGVRLLDIAEPGTLMQASRLLIPSCPESQLCVGGPLITPDGSKVFVTSVALSKAITTTVDAYSARTGQHLATVTPSVTASRGSPACEPLWTDPSGQQLAVFCGHAGVADGTRFKAADLHLPVAILAASGQLLAW
jgi:hypothetical protein